MASNLPKVVVLGDFEHGPPARPDGLTSVRLDEGHGRSIGGFSCSRGRSYELGQVEAGTCSITVEDPQETLNPSNTSSPLNSGTNKLALYRAAQVRAWWPGPDTPGNAIQAGTYGGTTHPGLENGGVNGWDATGAGTVASSTITPRSGTRCLNFLLTGPSATARAWVGPNGEHWGPWSIPGTLITYSAYLRVTTSGVSARFNLGGVLSGTAVSGGGWTRVSATVMATGLRTPLSLVVTGGSGTLQVFLDDEQVEYGVATPSAFTTSGPVFWPVWTGFIERYPQRWVDRGFRGQRPLELVDALSVLSRTVLDDTYEAEIAGDDPSLWLPFDDATGPGRAQGRLAGTVRMREFLPSKGGTIAWRGDTLPDGTPAVTLSQERQNPADLDYAGQVTSLDTRNATGWGPTLFTLNTGAATIEFWAKIDASVARIVFQSITSGNYLEPTSGDQWFGLMFYNYARSYLAVNLPGLLYGYPAAEDFVITDAYLDDGQWHYFAISFEPDPAVPGNWKAAYRFDASVREDGALAGIPLPITDYGINSINISALTRNGNPLSKVSVARVGFYPTRLPSARLRAHYQRGVGYLGEAPDQRALRILDRVYPGGARRVPVDSASAPLAADHEQIGGSALAALEALAATADGIVYAARDGEVVVETSVARHLDGVRTGWVFGEAAGELPYEDLRLDYDPRYVFSRVRLSRPGRSGPLEVVDAAIEDEIGQRTLSLTLDVLDDFELEQAATYRRRRYAAPRMRCERLVLRPDSKPELWPIVLAAEIGLRVTIRRRPRVGPMFSADFYIESITQDVNVAAGTWESIWELSPVWVDRAWVLGSSTAGALGTTAVPVY